MAFNQVDRVDSALIFAEACHDGILNYWTNGEDLSEVSALTQWLRSVKIELTRLILEKSSRPVDA